MKRERRLLIGKQLHEGSITVKECMERYGACRRSVFLWQEEYLESTGIVKMAKSQSKPLGVPAAAAGPSEYEAMGKPELIRELMRRDIEVARLKKGYSVKGGGSEKEYVISSGSSTK